MIKCLLTEFESSLLDRTRVVNRSQWDCSTDNKPTRVVYAFFVLTFFPSEQYGPISPEKKQVAYSTKAKS